MDGLPRGAFQEFFKFAKKLRSHRAVHNAMIAAHANNKTLSGHNLTSFVHDRFLDDHRLGWRLRLPRLDYGSLERSYPVMLHGFKFLRHEQGKYNKRGQRDAFEAESNTERTPAPFFLWQK